MVTRGMNTCSLHAHMLETQAHKKLHPRSAPRSVANAMKPPATGASAGSGSADAPRGEAPPLLGHEEPLARLLIRAAVAPQVDVLQQSAAIESVVLSVC